MTDESQILGTGIITNGTLIHELYLLPDHNEFSNERNRHVRVDQNLWFKIEWDRTVLKIRM